MIGFGGAGAAREAANYIELIRLANDSEKAIGILREIAEGIEKLAADGREIEAERAQLLELRDAVGLAQQDMERVAAEARQAKAEAEAQLTVLRDARATAAAQEAAVRDEVANREALIARNKIELDEVAKALELREQAITDRETAIAAEEAALATKIASLTALLKGE